MELRYNPNIKIRKGVHMWLNEEVFYMERFLSKDTLEEIDSIISENMDEVNRVLSGKDSGGYHTFPSDHKAVKRVGTLMLDFLKSNKITFNQFYPRDEIQYLGANSNQSVHIDGNGSGEDVRWGLVVYLTDSKDYDGGEIFYPKYDLEIKPERGSIAIHRGNVEHGVKAVSRNPRFVIVGFAS